MATKIWKIYSIVLTSDARKYGRRAHYAYTVEGTNTETGVGFVWSIPAESLKDERYDLQDLKVPSIPTVP